MTRRGQHANLGKGFEAVLDDMHLLYEQSGRCSVFRTPPAMKVLRPVKGTSTFVCCYAGLGPPDYIAQAQGRSFMFDAKDVATGTRWDFDALPRHQAERMDRHERHGGLAFVLVRLEGKAYLLPWEDLGRWWWSWKKGTEAGRRALPGTASLPLATTSWALRVKDLDWLTVALTLPWGPEKTPF